MASTQIIAARFRGPPTSGNGGYCCGVLAARLPHSAEAVTVTLRAPPPLDAELAVQRVDGGGHAGVALYDGDTRIADAVASTLELDVPPCPSFAAATEAAARFRGFDRHVFPECFVCGPARQPGDGLCIFAGPLGDGSSIVAAPWCPDGSLADASGRVQSEYLWAALDCPGYFALAQPDLTALLGRMTAKIVARPAPGARCVVLGWPLASDGRKHDVGTAVVGENGSLFALARARWIALR